jgi:hypothetical protein
MEIHSANPSLSCSHGVRPLAVIVPLSLSMYAVLPSG